VRPSVLGAIGWLLLLGGLYSSAFGWVTPRKVRDALRDPLNGELDESLACDLVTDFVHVGSPRVKVACAPALVVSGDAARASAVKVDSELRTYCFARVDGWRVLREATGMPCFPTAPEDRLHPLAAERARMAATAQTRLRERLAGVRAAMESEVRPLKCNTRGQAHGEVPVLEFELLQGSGADEWRFLSTPWLRDAVVKRTPVTELAAADLWGRGRPWVAVVTSASRVSAAMAPESMTEWQRGKLTGTLTLVDAAAGTLLCEAPFEFSSSPKLAPLPRVRARNGPVIPPILDLPTEARVTADFHDRYHEAVRRLDELTGARVGAWLY
jgi:hypothetical protein